MRQLADTGDNTTTNAASKTVTATQTALPNRRHRVWFLKLLCVKEMPVENLILSLGMPASHIRTENVCCLPLVEVATKL